MRIRFCFWLLVGALLFSSCTEEEKIRSLAKRTVLVYIAADNNLTSLALEDLEELKTGMAQVSEDALRLLVYIDSGSSARLVELCNRDGEVVENIIREYDSRNSVGLEETKEVFNDVFSNPNYQAESYGLIYWSHADGWIPYQQSTGYSAQSRSPIRWIGQDREDGFDYRMNLSEFKSVLEEAPHFNFIMFDACFMMSVEVAYELRHYTDYYIACPTENPGPGAPYDLLVPLMDRANAAVEMASTYYGHYENRYTGGSGMSNNNWTGGVAVGVLQTSKLESLAMQTNQLLPENADVDLLAEVFDYDQRSLMDGYVGYFDLPEIMQSLLPEEDYSAWLQNYESALVYWNTTDKNYSQFVGMFSMERANGVTQYLPISSSSVSELEAYHSLEWYQDAGLDKLGW